MKNVRRNIVLVWVVGTLLAYVPILAGRFYVGEDASLAASWLTGKLSYAALPTIGVVLAAFFVPVAKDNIADGGQVFVLYVLSAFYLLGLIGFSTYYMFGSAKLDDAAYGALTPFLPLATAGVFYVLGINKQSNG